jgi:histidinol dehydrogenase
MINFKEIDIKEKVFSIELDNFLNTLSLNSSEVSSIVAEIITSVRNKGDEAIRFYTKQFDKIDCGMPLEFKWSQKVKSIETVVSSN